MFRSDLEDTRKQMAVISYISEKMIKTVDANVCQTVFKRTKNRSWGSAWFFLTG